MLHHTPLLYSKTGINRGIPINIIFDPNTDWRYLLEPPRQCGSNMYTINVLSIRIKNIKICPMKFSFFTTEKNLCTCIFRHQHKPTYHKLYDILWCQINMHQWVKFTINSFQLIIPEKAQ